MQEYLDKYDDYCSINKILESYRYLYEFFAHRNLGSFVLFQFISFLEIYIYISIVPRNDFQKLGEDLKLTKGRDMVRYNKIVEDLNESYRKYGEVIFYLLPLYTQSFLMDSVFDMFLKIDSSYLLKFSRELDYFPSYLSGFRYTVKFGNGPIV